jgi:hypothetical protein
MHFRHAPSNGAARAAIAIVHDAKTVEFDTCRIPATRTVPYRAYNGAPDSGANRDASDP